MKRFLARHTLEIVIAAALTVAALVILFTGTPAASDPQANKIMISSAWSRPTIGQHANGAVYLTIHNAGMADDKLTGARTDISKKAELHQTTNEGGVMRMRHLHDGLDVPARATVGFAPAGHHIMLIGLKAPLARGQTFLLTLLFEKAGAIEIPVTVNIMAPEQAAERGSHNR